MDAKGLKVIESLTGGEVSHNSTNDNFVRHFFLKCGMGVVEAVGALAHAGLMAQDEIMPPHVKPQLKFRGYAVIPPAKSGLAPKFDESRLLLEDVSEV